MSPMTPASEWPTFGLIDDMRGPILESVERGRPFALATIYAADGGPRPVGAQMVVTGDACWGFLSGGCIEEDVAIHARATLGDGEPRLLTYGRGSPFIDMRLPCGGRIDVLVERVGAADRAVDALLAFARRRVPALWQSNGRERRCGPADGLAALAEPIVEHIYAPPQRLAVVGADPFALAIAGVGSRIGWDTTLLAPFGPSAPLPFAARCDRRPARDALADLKPDRWTAIAVVTHDLDADEEILVPALRSAAGYVGVLGSRRKLAERARRIRGAGLDDAQIGRLKAPIGLDLGAGTPWEVALSVAAEIIESRRDVPISVRYERSVVDLLEAEQAR
jgi:xanthine dehydrogenase accessory factor